MDLKTKESRFDSPKGHISFLIMSNPALGQIQSPIRQILDSYFAAVRWPGLKSDHSPSCEAEVKNNLHGEVLK